MFPTEQLLTSLFQEEPYAIGELKIVALPIRKPWIPTRDELISLVIEANLIFSIKILTLSLDQRRNTQCSVLQEIILTSLDILGK